MKVAGAVILGDAPAKLPARSIVVASRLPRAGERTGAGAFDALGDVVVDCDVEGCGWHAMGSRADVGQAVADHNRQFHTQEAGALVMLINDPRRHS